MDAFLDESIDDVFGDYNSTSYLPHTDNESVIASVSDSESTIDVPVLASNLEAESPKTDRHRTEGDKEAEFAHLAENLTLNVGDRVLVFWYMDNKYYEVTVTRINARTGTHKITYDDEDQGDLQMENK